MKKFGLIGHPISHSLSPSLFKAGYDGKYTYDLIEGDDFEESYKRFIEGYHGINVTAPFKERAFAKADILSEECRLIKATNLLVKTPDGVKAYNSDFLGVRMWLEEIHDEILTDKVLIVGCGGAGKAAAIAAASLGMKVILMNRDISKAEAIAQSISEMPGAQKAEVLPIEKFRGSFRECDIIIYNIPTRIPDINELTDSDFTGGAHIEGKARRKHLLEANYKNPSFDIHLIDIATKANPYFTYTEGRTWLLYQALTGYEIFIGESPDLQHMTDVL